jgi:hypothetical protein
MVDVRLFRVRLFWLLVLRALVFGSLAARHHGHIAPLGDQRVARQFVHCDKAIVIKWILWACPHRGFESGQQQTKGSLLPNASGQRSASSTGRERLEVDRGPKLMAAGVTGPKMSDQGGVDVLGSRRRQQHVVALRAERPAESLRAGRGRPRRGLKFHGRVLQLPSPLDPTSVSATHRIRHEDGVSMKFL